MENFAYKPGVRDKVSELESRLASTGGKGNFQRTNSLLQRQLSQDNKKHTTGHLSNNSLSSHPPPSNDSNNAKQSNLQHGLVLNASTIAAGRISPNANKNVQNSTARQQQQHLSKQSKPQSTTKEIAHNISSSISNNSSDCDKRSTNERKFVMASPNKDMEKGSTKPTPVPAPRRMLPENNVEEHGNNETANIPPRPGSASSTRRSSEDDGIADMASESDPFDDSSMPLPKIKENPFLQKERRKATMEEEEESTRTAPNVPSAKSLLRRGSLNPQFGLENREESPRPFRTRTESTNSAENFVVQQISADTVDNRRESQAEVKIDVLHSKGSQNTDTGIRSPVVVRSKTLSNSTASILVLGLPQSGKSSTIDSLVQRSVTRTNESKSSEIVEYTAKIKILDSLSLFSLKIIETPGYSNDPTIFSDAQLMSTLLEYVESKDGLRGQAPTIVLVVFRFDDQRLWNPEDEHPNIVNFLKLLHKFEKHLSGKKFANFVFVLTHFQSENTSEQERRKPEGKIVELINLIQKYTSLPPPILVVCAENPSSKETNDKSNIENNRTPMTVVLSNGQTYPFNLIEKIKTLLTKKGRDSVGETVLRTAFGIEYPYSIRECEVTRKIPLLPVAQPQVQQMQKMILQAYRDIEKTEIFTLLEIGWENIDPEIRKKYPESLYTVQQIFQTKKVCNFSDIPEDPVKILSLVRQMPSNLAAKDLLIDTLQLKVPACYPALYVGQGFDLGKDTTTNVSPFQFTTGLKTSAVGLIPSDLECKIRDDREISFKFFSEVEEYVSERLKDLNLRYSISPNSLPALSAAASSSATGQRWGYNLVRKNLEPNKSTIATAVIEYRIFQVTLHEQQPNLKFKPQFWEAVQEIPDLDIKNPISVTAWRDFFGYWGTHVVKSAYGGGSVDITFRGNVLSKIYNSMRKDFMLPSDEYDTTRVFQWVTGDGLDFVASCGKDVKNDFVQGYDVEAHFHGGDIKYQQVDLTKVESKEEVTNIREDWKESLNTNPVMLETNLVLVPLSYYVREKSEGIATKIDVALHYFYSDFMVSQGKQSSCSIL